jgi:hypothetical protein
MPITLNGSTGITTPSIDASAGNSALTTLSVGGNNISNVNGNWRNRVINPGMVIDQRNAGASVANIGNGAFIVDRFYYDRAGLGITAQFTASQSTDVPTGFQYSAKLDTTTAQTLGATGGTYIGISHKIEGYNMADLAGNTATLSFRVKATKTGTYSVVLKNSGSDRSLVCEYTVSASNTWESKTVSIPTIPTAGTWNYTNGTGLQIFWCIAVADDVATSTIGSWISSNVFGSVNNAEGADSTANDFLITGVQLEAGSVATPFERRDYGRELMMCQRYYEKSYATNVVPGTNTDIGLQIFRGSSQGSGLVGSTATFKVAKRAVPSLSFWTAGGTPNLWNIDSASGGATVTPAATGVSDGQFYQNTAGGRGSWVICEYYGQWAASAEL